MRCIPKGRNHNSFPDTYDALHIPSLSGPPLRGMPLCRAGRVRHAPVLIEEELGGTGFPDLFKHLRQLLRAVEEQYKYGYIYKGWFHGSISFICKIRVCCNVDVYSLNPVIAYNYRISSLAQHLFGVVRGTFFLQIPFLSVEKYRLYSAV